MNRNDCRLEAGVRSLEMVRGILGDKFSFAQLCFWTDKTQEITDTEYEALRSMGWEREGNFYWRGE